MFFFFPINLFSVVCKSGKKRNRDHQFMTIYLVFLEARHREVNLLFFSLFYSSSNKQISHVVSATGILKSPTTLLCNHATCLKFKTKWNPPIHSFPVPPQTSHILLSFFHTSKISILASDCLMVTTVSIPLIWLKSRFFLSGFSSWEWMSFL